MDESLGQTHSLSREFKFLLVYLCSFQFNIKIILIKIEASTFPQSKPSSDGEKL